MHDPAKVYKVVVAFDAEPGDGIEGHSNDPEIENTHRHQTQEEKHHNSGQHDDNLAASPHLRIFLFVGEFVGVDEQLAGDHGVEANQEQQRHEEEEDRRGYNERLVPYRLDRSDTVRSRGAIIELDVVILNDPQHWSAEEGELWIEFHTLQPCVGLCLQSADY